MAETQNFFDNPANGSNAGWGAGLGALVGGALGSGGFGGFGGNREPAVTPDQLQATVNSLQSSINTDALQEQIGGVKDAINHGNAHTGLALCGIGHSVTSGFASVNQTILLQSAAGRELALQQALDAERARATELRIALSEHKNQAGHAATQVLLNQVISAK